MNWGLPSSLRRAGEIALELFAWWSAELRDAGQSAQRRLPSRQTPQLFVRVGAAAISIEKRSGADWTVVGTVPRAADGSWPAELPGLPADLAGARAAIMLEAADVFFCDFELPLAAERHLGSVLRLQLERALPVPLDHVLFDRQVVSRDRQRDVLQVRAAVAHRDRVETLRELALRWGLNPVGAGMLAADASFTFNFLKRRRDPLRWLPTPQDRWLLRAAVAGIGVLALTIGVQWTLERAAVNERSAELHMQAERISTERTRLTREAEPLLALQSIAATRDAPAVLAALSSGVPATAWFNQVDIVAHVDQPGRIRLTGAVTAREEALSAVRALPGVRNLQTSSAFNGQILGPENLELVAEFDAAIPQAAL